MGSEKIFENKVKKYLNERNCWGLKTWSNGIQRQGVPDLLVCCNSYFLGIEVKAETGKPSELQLYNIDEIRRAGGIGIVLYPQQFEEFQKLVSMLITNDIDEAYLYQYKFDVI